MQTLEHSKRNVIYHTEFNRYDMQVFGKSGDRYIFPTRSTNTKYKVNTVIWNNLKS